MLLSETNEQNSVRHMRIILNKNKSLYNSRKKILKILKCEKIPLSENRKKFGQKSDRCTDKIFRLCVGMSIWKKGVRTILIKAYLPRS